MINEIVKSGFQNVSNVRSTDVQTARSASSPDPVTSETVQPKQEEKADSAQLQAAVSKLNDFVQSIQRRLSFSVEESTGRTIVKVYDAETDELIRQIPPEETLKLAEAIKEQTASLFVKERA